MCTVADNIAWVPGHHQLTGTRYNHTPARSFHDCLVKNRIPMRYWIMTMLDSITSELIINQQGFGSRCSPNTDHPSNSVKTSSSWPIHSVLIPWFQVTWSIKFSRDHPCSQLGQEWIEDEGTHAWTRGFSSSYTFILYIYYVHTTVGALPPMASSDPGCHGRCILDIPLKIAQEKYKNGIDIQYTTDMG